MFPSKAVRVIIHIAGWLLFFGLIIGFIVSSPEGKIQIRKIFSFPFLLFFSTYLFIFYVNSELLIPGLYLQKKYFIYFLFIIILFGAVFYLQPFDQLISHQQHPFNRPPPPPGGMNRFPPPSGRKIDIVSVVLFIMVWSLSTALQIIKQWRRSEQRAMRAEADKAQAELSF